jgi:F-type H+-transporting ATPase subunit a
MATENGHGPITSGEYIQHHLQNLQVCKADSGDWVWNQCAGNPMGVNVDSMFWSILLGLVFIVMFGIAAKKSFTRETIKISSIHRNYCRFY